MHDPYQLHTDETGSRVSEGFLGANRCISCLRSRQKAKQADFMLCEDCKLCTLGTCERMNTAH